MRPRPEPPYGKRHQPLRHALHLMIRAVFVREHIAPLSLIIWLMCVAGFAIWTLLQYQVPSGEPWIGMTIHTSVFAFWLLVAREWLLIQLRRSALPPRKHDTHF